MSTSYYFHKNIIRYSNRPFNDINEMNEEMIYRHNSVVKKGDITIHAGDFLLVSDKDLAEKIIKRLNGKHIFLMGSHDRWLKNNQRNAGYILELKYRKQLIVICHYAMRTWNRNHYNSWHLYAHSHGRLPSIGKSMDIGVDCNNYYPFSLDQIISIMETKEDNPNLIVNGKKKYDK